jgi:hypothetical protein
MLDSLWDFDFLLNSMLYGSPKAANQAANQTPTESKAAALKKSQAGANWRWAASQKAHHFQLTLASASHSERLALDMITKFLTSVRTSFNPFTKGAKPARVFLSLLPPQAQSPELKVKTEVLPQSSTARSFLELKFST